MPNEAPFLSVVMPAYNEVRNFKDGVLEPSFAYLRKQKYTWEVIFVNDGSTDDTAKILGDFCRRTPGCRLITIPHGGKPVAEIKGMLAAKGKYVLYTDFDQSTALKELDVFLPYITSGKYDIVIGSRGGAENKHKDDSSYFKFRSKAFASITRNLFSLKITDFFCGYKLFTHEAAQKIFSAIFVSIPKGIKGGYMGFTDPEVLFVASKLGYRVKEIPVDWKRRPTHGHPIKEPLYVIQKMVEMKLADLQGKYNSL